MEQKRKVKSLISKNDVGELGYLSKLLIILSCLFCFLALSLTMFSMTFVDASDGVSYNGLDEKSEVLYKLDFVKKSNLSGVVSTMRVDDKEGIDKLYVTPVPVVIEKGDYNVIGLYMNGKYVNLLGGNNLNISGDNISIIGGSDLYVSETNDNVTILGGSGNKIISTSSSLSVPNVIVGGNNNTVKGNNAVILGGQKNTIVGNDSFILGGELNNVSGGISNAIVAGYKVTANQSNIFVFSNDNNGFIPKKGAAFYINVQNGLGINVKSKNNSVVLVSGAVSFGNLSCNNDCDGLIGISAGSLQGYSKNSLKKLGIDDEPVVPDNKNGYCTGADYLKMERDGNERYTSCASTGGYKNVVFETKILTGIVNCSGVSVSNGANPCVYTCADHYSYDKIEDMCMKDCVIPWSEGEYKEHSGTIIGFATGGASCVSANNACAGVRAVLRCNDGKWEKLSGAGPDVMYEGIQILNYKNKSCSNQENILCDKSVYGFTTKIVSYWTGEKMCKDYKVEEKLCKSVTYYTGRCFINHTLTGENCKLGEDTSGCVCKGNSNWKICDSSGLPFNAKPITTGFRQHAMPVDAIMWDSDDSNYYYSGSKKPCRYECKNGYDYVKKNDDLKIDKGCWSGCKLPWDVGSGVVHGTVITGYDCSEGKSDDYLEMICIEGKWRNLNEWKAGNVVKITTPPDEKYNSRECNISF